MALETCLRSADARIDVVDAGPGFVLRSDGIFGGAALGPWGDLPRPGLTVKGLHHPVWRGCSPD
jgi:hypothetical protein